MGIKNILRGFSFRRGLLSGEKTLKYVNITLGVLLIIAILVLARDAVEFMYGKDEPNSMEGAAVSQTRRSPVRKPLGYYTNVVEQNVFGIKNVKLRALGVPITDAARRGVPATPSSLGHLTLLGTVAWADGTGYAFITSRGGDQQVYKTGDEVEGAGKLVQVTPLSAVIDAAGTIHEIELKEIGEPVASSSGGPRATVPPGTRGTRAAQNFARQTSDTSYVVDQKAVEESIENPQNIMTDARVIPYMVEGKQKGFLLKEVKKPGVYHSLGLQNEDVLLSVNEFELSTPQSALQAFAALKGMDYIELNIIRSGNNMTLTYSLR